MAIHCTHVNFLSAGWFMQAVLPPCPLGDEIMPWNCWSGRAQKNFALWSDKTCGCDLKWRGGDKFLMEAPKSSLTWQHIQKEGEETGTKDIWIMVLITQTKEEERKIQHIQNWKVSCDREHLQGTNVPMRSCPPYCYVKVRDTVNPEVNCICWAIISPGIVG